MGRIKVVSEWFFEYEDGSIQGPFLNSFTSAGLAKIAERIQGLSSPYLVIGDDTAPGFVITEVFRKPVSMITRDENMVRFRTQLLTQEGNGDHQKTCIFFEASDVPGTGTMLNMLRQLWSKTEAMILAIECRILIQDNSGGD